MCECMCVYVCVCVCMCVCVCECACVWRCVNQVFKVNYGSKGQAISDMGLLRIPISMSQNNTLLQSLK